jgi:hypothetical protein
MRPATSAQIRRRVAATTLTSWRPLIVKASLWLPTKGPTTEDADGEIYRSVSLDVHAASTTFAVIRESGKRLGAHIVETNGQALVEQLKSIPGKRHVCLEEGTQSAWIYAILSPDAEEVVIAMVPESRGQKSDESDAFLAHLGLPTEPPPLARARDPAQRAFGFEQAPPRQRARSPARQGAVRAEVRPARLEAGARGRARAA